MTRPSPATDPDPRRLIVLGSTGSIGVNTLAVAEHLTRISRHRFDVVGLAAGNNSKLLREQAQQFNAGDTALLSPAAGHPPNSTRHRTGQDAALRLVQETDADLVVSAIVGVAGLRPTVAAIDAGMSVALANKETLVAAGELVIPLAEKRGVPLLPIDSEHSAIFQCLSQGDPTKAVKRIVLTASGGPFRTADADKIKNATPEQALNHPTWDMGPKITVDSATMMNKALEIIEAHHLFQLPPEKIDVVIHPQSVVHGFVEFNDHSVLAQMGPPDMRTPIQYALTYPDRPNGCSDTLDWRKLSRLDFEQPDGERFPALKLAYDVIRAGGTAGAVLNAANEAAVEAFLERRIRLGRIVELVADALEAVGVAKLGSLEDAFEADRLAREHVAKRLENEPVSTR